MFVFGHMGLTLGAAVLLSGFFAKDGGQTDGENEQIELPQSLPGPAASKSPATGTRSRLKSLADRVDIRILLIGSLLPDIIDKPIGRILFGDVFNSGYIFGHTLLFLMVITAGGLLLYRAGAKTWLIALAFGTFTHLILDGMWMSPRTLLWPLFGFSFEKHPLSVWSWIAGLLHHVAHDPWVLIPEIAGVITIAWLGWHLVRRGKLFAFLKYGQV